MFIQYMSQFFYPVFNFSHLLPCLLILPSFFLHNSIASSQLYLYTYQTMGWTKSERDSIPGTGKKKLSFLHPALTHWKTHSIICRRKGPKRVLHTVRNSVSSFNFHYPGTSWRSSRSSLRLLPRLPLTSVFLFFFPSVMCFIRQFLDRMWLSFPSLFLLYVGYSCPFWLYVILHFSHDRSNWYSPSFSNTTFQNILDISDLLFKASKFQYHTQLPSNFSTLLFSSLNLSPIFWCKIPLIFECCFYHGNPRFNFTCRLQFVSCYPNTLKIPNSPIIFDPVVKEKNLKGVYVSGLEADHSPSYGNKHKYTWNYSSNLPYTFMARRSHMHEDNFIIMLHNVSFVLQYCHSDTFF
jgi:hypothetical protein